MTAETPPPAAPEAETAAQEAAPKPATPPEAAPKPATPPDTLATLAIDFGPAVVFYAFYQLTDINIATIAVTVAAVIGAIASRMLTGRVSPALIVTTTLAIVFGVLTIIMKDPQFVKVKSTLTNLILGLILLIGLPFKRPLLKPVLAPRFPPMAEAGWFQLSRNFGWFFIAMAGINELVWRNFSDQIWVNYNLWGDVILTMGFGATQLPIIERHMDQPPTTQEKAELIPPQI